MAHPYKAAAHKNDPKWLSGLSAEKRSSDAADADTYRVIENYGSAPEPTKAATYVGKGK